MNADTGSFESMNAGRQTRRKAERINLTHRDDCFAYIREQAYFIRDISMNGIGLVMRAEESLMLSKVIGDVLTCRIKVIDQSMSNLKYRLVYLSPGHGDNMNCGLEWVNQDENENKQVFKKMIDQIS